VGEGERGAKELKRVQGLEGVGKGGGPRSSKKGQKRRGYTPGSTEKETPAKTSNVWWRGGKRILEICFGASHVQKKEAVIALSLQVLWEVEMNHIMNNYFRREGEGKNKLRPGHESTVRRNGARERKAYDQTNGKDCQRRWDEGGRRQKTCCSKKKTRWTMVKHALGGGDVGKGASRHNRDSC